MFSTCGWQYHIFSLYLVTPFYLLPAHASWFVITADILGSLEGSVIRTAWSVPHIPKQPVLHKPVFTSVRREIQQPTITKYLLLHNT